MKLKNPFSFFSRKQITAPVETVALQAAPPPPSTLDTRPSSNFLVPAAQARWLAAGISQYTPQRVEQVFRMALAGDLSSQWEMFDLMEATWPRLSKNLNELKDFPVSLAAGDQPGTMRYIVKPFALQDAEPSATAITRKKLVEEALWNMNPNPDSDENELEDTVRDIMDARGKGISVLEIDYQTRHTAAGFAVVPRCTRWVHPDNYGYPTGKNVESNRLMLKSGGSRYGGATGTFTPFPEHKFIIAVCKNKTGHPLGAAMLHVLGFAWSSFNFTAEWRLNFAQIFGQPIRWANYDPNMSPADQAKLIAALANMGSNAYGAFPAGTQLELKESSKSSSDDPQASLMADADKMCDFVILRQTLTSDVSNDGGSRALGEVHERKEDGVKIGCAKWTAKVLKQLIRSICILNFGDDSECPTLSILMENENEDKELGELLVDVNSSGLEPTDEALPEISKRLGFEVQRQAKPAPTAPGGARTAALLPDETEEKEKSLAAKDGGRAQAPRPKTDAVDLIAARRAKMLADVYRGSMAPFREAVLASSSKEDAMARLEKLYTDWKPEKLNQELEIALQICAAAGAAEAKNS